MKKYTNARDALPECLLNEIQKFCTGMVYVPGPSEHRQRRKLVISLFDQGLKAKEIAGIAGLGSRRVNQIIAEECDGDDILLQAGAQEKSSHINNDISTG